MANWAKGTMKIRGTRENIKKFLSESLIPCVSFADNIQEFMTGEKPKKPQVEIKEDEWEYTMECKNGFSIKGCHRNFIREIEWYFCDADEEILVIDDYSAAWGVDVEPLINLSKTHNIDIKIFVFERGMEFNQEVEIHKGRLIKNNNIEFDNYKWDCIFPNIGG